MTLSDDLGSFWHHRPPHRFEPGRAYMVTASTLGHERIFHGPERLALVAGLLTTLSREFGWDLEAWAVLENHYHFVGIAPDAAAPLRRLVSALHMRTAREVNRLDGTAGRRVWFQYRDTCLTYPASYYARIHYVLENPVKHGLVAQAEDYPFCSAAEFAANQPPAHVRRVRSFRCDRVNVEDDF